ncbi:MAG: hypothetical protein LUF30_06610 [Lachnospiraceae bacterium]|nr:hypothetical protein [Lachnospiraceae bacterium]
MRFGTRNLRQKDEKTKRFLPECERHRIPFCKPNPKLPKILFNSDWIIVQNRQYLKLFLSNIHIENNFKIDYTGKRDSGTLKPGSHLESGTGLRRKQSGASFSGGWDICRISRGVFSPRVTAVSSQ